MLSAALFAYGKYYILPIPYWICPSTWESFSFLLLTPHPAPTSKSGEKQLLLKTMTIVVMKSKSHIFQKFSSRCLNWLFITFLSLVSEGPRVRLNVIRFRKTRCTCICCAEWGVCCVLLTNGGMGQSCPSSCGCQTVAWGRVSKSLNHRGKSLPSLTLQPPRPQSPRQFGYYFP